MADTACIAHAGSCQDHLGCLVIIDLLGFLCGHQGIKIFKIQRINALFHHLHGFLIKAAALIGGKDTGSLHRQRTVQIYRKMGTFSDQLLLFDQAQEVQHLLSASHRKGRDQHIAAPGKSAADDLCQLLYIILCVDLSHSRAVESVSIGRLDQHIVSLLGGNRVSQQRLIHIADIPGKDDLPGLSLLCQPQLYTGRAQQMSHIRKPKLYTLAKLHLAVIRKSLKTPQQPFGILHGKKRFYGLAALCAIAVFVFPGCVRLLDVRCVF